MTTSEWQVGPHNTAQQKGHIRLHKHTQTLSSSKAMSERVRHSKRVIPLVVLIVSLQGRGAPRGGRGGSGIFRGRHGGGPQGPQPTMDKPKREAILDLSKYVNERIRVKFTGGREGLTRIHLGPNALSLERTVFISSHGDPERLRSIVESCP